MGLSLPPCYRCHAQPCQCKDGITLYHADCREVLPLLEPVDLLLTDPPYGIKASSTKFGSTNKGKVKDYGKASWDDTIQQDAIDTACVIATWACVFGGNYYSLPPSSCWLVWDKDNTGDFADCELAWTNWKKAVRKFRWRWNGMIKETPEHRWHPTQKPLALMTWCLRQAPSNCRTILDPFMGSGTTLRAAKDLGRPAIGIEIEEKYCEIAARRLEQEVLFT